MAGNNLYYALHHGPQLVEVATGITFIVLLLMVFANCWVDKDCGCKRAFKKIKRTLMGEDNLPRRQHHKSSPQDDIEQGQVKKRAQH